MITGGLAREAGHERLLIYNYDGFNFGNFVRQFPHLQGSITDLLVGDLFTGRVDQVWGPMESLYEPGKPPIPPWDASISAERAAIKVNELVLPEGRKP